MYTNRNINTTVYDSDKLLSQFLSLITWDLHCLSHIRWHTWNFTPCLTLQPCSFPVSWHSSSVHLQPISQSSVPAYCIYEPVFMYPLLDCLHCLYALPLQVRHTSLFVPLLFSVHLGPGFCWIIALLPASLYSICLHIWILIKLCLNFWQSFCLFTWISFKSKPLTIYFIIFCLW